MVVLVCDSGNKSGGSCGTRDSRSSVNRDIHGSSILVVGVVVVVVV